MQASAKHTKASIEDLKRELGLYEQKPSEYQPPTESLLDENKEWTIHEIVPNGTLLDEVKRCQTNLRKNP